MLIVSYEGPGNIFPSGFRIRSCVSFKFSVWEMVSHSVQNMGLKDRIPGYKSLHHCLPALGPCVQAL